MYPPLRGSVPSRFRPGSRLAPAVCWLLCSLTPVTHLALTPVTKLRLRATAARLRATAFRQLRAVPRTCNTPGLPVLYYSTPSAPAPTLGIEPVCPSARPRVVLAPARQRDCECSLLSRWRHLRRTSENPRLQHPLSGQVSAPAVAAARNHTAATRSLHPPLPVGGGLLFLSFFFFSFGVLFTWGSGEALISAICGLPSHFDTNSNQNRNPLSLCRPSRTGSFLIHTTQNGL